MSVSPATTEGGTSYSPWCWCWVPAGVTVTNDVILNNVGMGGFVEFEHYKSHYVCVQLKDHVTLNLTKLSTQNIKYF